MKHLFICSLYLVMAITPIQAEKASKSVSQAQKKLNVVTQKLKKQQPKITKKKKQKKQAEYQIKKLNRKLFLTERKLKVQRNKLYRVLKKKRQVTKELGQVEKDFEEKRAALSQRVTNVYKRNDHGLLSLMMTPETFIQDMDTAFFIKKILKKDQTMVKDVKEEYERIKTKKTQLEHLSHNITSMKQSIERQERRYSRQRDHKKKIVRSLKSQIVKLERQYRELEKSSSDLTSFIIKSGKGKIGYYGTGKFLKPVKGWISSRFGTRRHPIFKRRIRHNGMDFAAPKGRRIKAADSGVVLFAGRAKKYRGYGKVTVIDHGLNPKIKKRISTFYAHQSRILVKKGDFIKKGQEIGWVGSTGYSTGPHLHFEIRYDGVPINPQKHLRI